MHDGVCAIRREATIPNALGLHLRAAARFVHLAVTFRAKVWVECGDNRANGKSVLDLACLAAGCGQTLALEASGADAEAAVAALAALVLAGFHERDDGSEVPAADGDRRTSV